MNRYIYFPVCAISDVLEAWCGHPLEPIVKKIWPFLFYCLYYAAASGVFPYAALYYQSIGLSGTQVGLMLGLSPLVALVGGPLLTGIADKTQRHRLVLSLALVVIILWSLVVPFTRAFPVLVLLITINALASAPINSLADSATMSMLGDERAMYGRIRMGGTIGWGLMALITGRIVDTQGLIWIFWIYAVGMTLNLLVAQKFSFGKPEAQTPFWSGVGALLSDRRWLTFLSIALIAGIGNATINSYQFVFMADIGATETLMGLSLTISTLSELPAMFFGNRLLKRFKPQGLLLLGTVIIGVRLLLYAAFNFPTAVLAIQAIHGLTFPIIWVAGVSFAHENAPAGLNATAQGLFGAATFGIGSGLGSFLGGLAIDGLGSRGMYLIFGGFVLLSLAIVSFAQNRFQRAYAKTL